MRVFAPLMVLLLVACKAEPPRPDFRAALETHLSAIEAKDIEAYKPTVTSEKDLRIIFPGGESIDSTEDVIAFHEGWFTDPNWRWQGEVLKIFEGEDLAAAFMKYDYRDTPDGEPRAAWLLLMFKLEDGQWKLVHDQNTRITAQPETEDE